MEKEQEQLIAEYQARLDDFVEMVEEKDEEMEECEDANSQRMWREAKNQMSSKERQVQREIDRLAGLSKEDWPDRHDHFEGLFDKLQNEYRRVLAKI